jgi:uncharacterized membrane protein YgcG
MKNSFSTLLILLFINFFYVSGVLVIYFTTYYNSNNVHYKNCNAPLGEFALEPGVNSTNIKRSCGSDGKSLCSKRVKNLKEASDYCNQYSEICDRFAYNQKSNNVSIVDLKGKLVEANDINLFTRQVGITYDSPRRNDNAYNTITSTTLITEVGVPDISSVATSSGGGSGSGGYSGGSGSGSGSGGGGGGYGGGGGGYGGGY